MTVLVFDPVEFRLNYPEFANPTTYPDALLQRYWDRATCFVSPDSSACGCGLDPTACRRQMLDLMTAHLLKIGQVAAANGTARQVQGATIDKITVTLTPPPIPNQWQFWLGTTVYGQQLLALFQICAAGGYYVGGAPELSAFRRYAGRFF